MINVDRISKTFLTTKAVDNVSFDVEKGEVVGFLGPNGAGKSTTMRMLTCFMPPSSGTARIAGYDIYEDSLAIRRRIGYLPESAPLYPDMGVLDYLKYVAEIRLIPRGDIKSSIGEVVERCGLKSVLAKDINELSKGYRQRVGLAQALIHKPDIMILDEPTSGLDPNQIIEIRNLIKEIGKEKTILLSTHILPEVEATCDRMIIINRGTVIASGTTEELSSRAKHKDTVYITVRAARDAVEKALGAHSLFVNYEALPSAKDGSLRYSVHSGDPAACEELFRMAVENKWILTELNRESATLEDAFTHLTTAEPATQGAA